MLVPYIELAVQHGSLKQEFLEAVERVLERGSFILGDEVESFEAGFSAFCGSRYAVGVGTGTDALVLSLKALGIGPGDEVITPPNSFLASTSAIVLAGAKPVFVDVNRDFTLDPGLVEDAISNHTRAILPVHLTGRPAEMDAILEIAQKRRLHVVEDAAQAVGAEYRERKVGTMGVIGCFSLHPFKTLGACGDGGVVTTNDERVYRYLLAARNHGLQPDGKCKFWSVNSRLDAMQAALLNIKLKHVRKWTDARRKNASFYQKNLSDLLTVPVERPHEFAVYHTYIVQTQQRDALRQFLSERGIDTKVHYAVPIHLLEAAQSLGFRKGDFPVAEEQAQNVLSLPVHSDLRLEQLQYVVQGIKEFYQ